MLRGWGLIHDWQNHAEYRGWVEQLSKMVIIICHNTINTAASAPGVRGDNYKYFSVIISGQFCGDPSWLHHRDILHQHIMSLYEIRIIYAAAPPCSVVMMMLVIYCQGSDHSWKCSDKVSDISWWWTQELMIELYQPIYWDYRLEMQNMNRGHP